MTLRRNAPIYLSITYAILGTVFVLFQNMHGKFGIHAPAIMYWLGTMFIPQLAIVLTKALEYESDRPIRLIPFCIFAFSYTIYYFIIFSIFYFDHWSRRPGFEMIISTEFQFGSFVVDVMFGLLIYLTLARCFDRTSDVRTCASS